jgi:hypothetical protein
MITEGVHHLLETKPSEELLFPCSSSQQRCWFIHALSPGSSVLNIALRWELKGRFNAATIEQAFQSIIDRHEILRTRFIDKDGELVQEVAGRLDFHLSVVDLTAIPEEKRLDEAMALGRREAHLPFDIGQLPLIRVTLLRMSADHGLLLVTAHQIVFDGLSIRNLAHEFGTIAAALDAKRPHELPSRRRPLIGKTNCPERPISRFSQTMSAPLNQLTGAKSSPPFYRRRLATNWRRPRENTISPCSASVAP